MLVGQATSIHFLIFRERITFAQQGLEGLQEPNDALPIVGGQGAKRFRDHLRFTSMGQHLIDSMNDCSYSR